VPTTVLVVDDHPVVREGLSAVLADDPDFRVVGEAANGEEAMMMVERHRPDVVLLDERLPTTSGREVCAAIARRYPTVRVILATTFLDRSSIHSATAAGASGLLLKDSEPSTIRAAVRTVAAGRTFVDERASSAIASRKGRARGPFGLTPRELEVVELLPRGLTNARIAAELGVSEDTVKTHLKSIRLKLRARDRAEAAAIALREGLA
jgi:DNA-binding NarL/FixJ family response regulator